MPTPSTQYILTLQGGQTTLWTDASTLFPILSGGKVSATVMPTQAAIPSLPIAPPVGLAAAIVAITALRTTVNQLLAELRIAGLLAP